MDGQLKALIESPDRGREVKKYLSNKKDVLFEALKPYTEISIDNRLSIALYITAFLQQEKKRDAAGEKLFKEARTHIIFILPLQQEKSTLMALLSALEPSLLCAVREALLDHISHHRERQKFLQFWTEMLSQIHQRDGSAEGALLLSEHLVKTLITDGEAASNNAIPENLNTHVRELMRRKLYVLLYGRDKGKSEAAGKILSMVRASEPSPAEQAFDFPRWRLYEIEHRYELGLSGKDLLMEYAEDMLTLGEPKSYDAYGTLFSSTNSRLRTESATAFIEACRYRTEKPRGPADEFRKRAMEALSHSDGELPEDVALTVLSTHKSQGNFRELLRFFTTGGKSQPLEALDALLSCFIEIPAEQEQHLEELLPILLDSIKKGSPQIHELIAAKLSALPPTSPLRGSLRKNLKILLADLDVSADTRKHALEMLSHMGESKKPQKLNTSVLQELLDEPDDEEEESPDIQVIEEHFPIPAGLSSARRLPLPKELEAFLKLRDRPDVLKAAVQRLLQHHYEDIIGYYAHLFTAQDPLSGKMLFEHIVIAARTLLEYFQKESRTLRKGESLLEDKARDALFWTFFQKECPDLVKMESFEYLNSLHFLEASKADTLKRYALAFAREALTTRSQSAACRALADLINLRTSGRALDSLEGKSLDELLDSFTSLLFKENDREKRDRALTLLHHISFQNPRTLNPLALRIHPLHYVTAIDILSELVRRYNWSAGALLIEAAGNDYMDIRNKTVSALAVVGPMLWPDQKQRVVGIILEKLDDCYDEEARQIYLETILKIDPQSAARHLVARCLNASIHERREFMELLMHCLERLKAPLFFDWCDQGGHLASLRKILLSPPLDNATKNQAKRFVGLYRENHIRLRGRESWEALQNSPQDERWSIIREISKIM